MLSIGLISEESGQLSMMTHCNGDAGLTLPEDKHNSLDLQAVVAPYSSAVRRITISTLI